LDHLFSNKGDVTVILEIDLRFELQSVVRSNYLVLGLSLERFNDFGGSDRSPNEVVSSQVTFYDFSRRVYLRRPYL
jgi:hypothetical protein